MDTRITAVIAVVIFHIVIITCACMFVSVIPLSVSTSSYYNLTVITIVVSVTVFVVAIINTCTFFMLTSRRVRIRTTNTR